MFKKLNFSINYKTILFILLSTQSLYLIIHLQFLLGMPQAALAIQDSLFFMFTGIGLYLLSQGNKKNYFIGFLVILWPTVILQYFYIRIFDKPFLISELSKFITLLEVSTIPLKLFYSSLFILWSIGLYHTLRICIKHWKSLSMVAKIIPLIIICFYSYLFSNQILTTDIWKLSYIEYFFYNGIISTIRTTTKNYNITVSPENIHQSFTLLKEYESTRTQYPITDSPTTIPVKKRPIFMFMFESFYDFKHFQSFFPEDPFPKEYRELINDNTYTGPTRTHGSFDARFTGLTGSIPILPPSKELSNYPQTLPSILKQYGYTTMVLESVIPTYGLSSYYKHWGFDSTQFCIYGNDWSGKKTDPSAYEKNTIKIINDTPANITPFYFGFTYLGHGGSNIFTEKLEDPKQDISNYLALFEDKIQAKRLLKAAIFNARRLVQLKQAILEKYPNALIVFKTDHLGTEFYQLLDNNKNRLSQDFVKSLKKDPATLPFITIDGTNGTLPFQKGFSPANIPLMILAESKLPYKNTIPSLLYRNTPTNMISIYNTWYKKQGSLYEAIDILNETNAYLLEYSKAIETISLDLYKNNNPPITLDLLTNKK